MVKLRCIRHADILKRAYLCQVNDTGSPEPLVLISLNRVRDIDIILSRLDLYPYFVTYLQEKRSIFYCHMTFLGNTCNR
jgi:hypothetical protein